MKRNIIVKGMKRDINKTKSVTRTKNRNVKLDIAKPNKMKGKMKAKSNAGLTNESKLTKSKKVRSKSKGQGTKQVAPKNRITNSTSASKKTANSSNQKSKTIKIHILGGGREVGCNGFLVESSSKNVMLDYGLDVSNNQSPIFPKAKVDNLFLCHGHLDHVGSAAELRQRTKCNIYGTAATKDQTNLLLHDSLKLARIKKQSKNFTAKDAAELDEVWKTVTYGQEIKLGKSIKAKIYNAGHIPGSACVLLEIYGKKILYTSDFKTESTQLVKGADINIKDLDVLIMENTYSSRDHPLRNSIEKEFFDLVKSTVDAGGVALIPSFAIRAPELLLVLHKFNPDFPIYLDGMAKKATEISAHNADSVRNVKALKKAMEKTIFVQSHELRKVAVKRPGAIITTGGCMDGGPVVSYLKALYQREDSKLILTGFQIPGTAGRYLTETGRYVNEEVDLKLKMPLYQFDFSAHAGRTELLNFVQKLRPKKAICIHGDHSQRFATELRGRFSIDAIAPKNGDVLEI